MSFSDSTEDLKSWRKRDSLSTDTGRNMRVSNVPAKYHNLGWDDYRDSAGVIRSDGSQARLKEVLQGYADYYRQHRDKGLVLLGPPGCGKTLGASLVALDLVRAHAWVRFATYPEIVLRRQEQIRLDSMAMASSDWVVAERARQWTDITTDHCDLLVLDDVGKEYRAASGYADAGLDELLRSRTNAGKATIITSNLARVDWNSYNQSMDSFLDELGEVVEVERSTDFRRPARRREVRDAAR